jgi:hypothetical protein
MYYTYCYQTYPFQYKLKFPFISKKKYVSLYKALDYKKNNPYYIIKSISATPL